jgi:hypothetical protein
MLASHILWPGLAKLHKRKLRGKDNVLKCLLHPILRLKACSMGLKSATLSALRMWSSNQGQRQHRLHDERPRSAARVDKSLIPKLSQGASEKFKKRLASKIEIMPKETPPKISDRDLTKIWLGAFLGAILSKTLDFIISQYKSPPLLPEQHRLLFDSIVIFSLFIILSFFLFAVVIYIFEWLGIIHLG